MTVSPRPLPILLLRVLLAALTVVMLVCTNASAAAITWDRLVEPAGPGDDPLMSADGSCIVFVSRAQLTADDTDRSGDVFERCGDQLIHVSVGPNGGNAAGATDSVPKGISGDGRCVVFSTPDPLLAADTNPADDLYERCGASLTMITQGPVTSDGTFRGRYDGMSSDGRCVVFDSILRYVPQDTDDSQDVYESCDGAISEVSIGDTGGNGNADASFGSMTPDGACVSFGTKEQLVADGSGLVDSYERCGTTLWRGGGVMSRDGSCAVFVTIAQLSPADSDAWNDLYKRCGTTTSLVSSGPTGASGPNDATYVGASGDLACVVFTSADGLVANDVNGEPDLYENCEGTTKLISDGAPGDTPRVFDYGKVSDDGRCVSFLTPVRLTSDAPDDGNRYAYENCDGTTRLISRDETGAPVVADRIDGMSPDGSRVLFGSSVSLYARVGGETRLVSRLSSDESGIPRSATFWAADAVVHNVLFARASSQTDPGGLFRMSVDAPGVALGGVRDVSSTSESVTGHVNAEGSPTSVHIEFGRDTSYGSRTPDVAAGADASDFEFTQTLGGLPPDTTIHFRLVATNSSGTVRGADHEFVTLPAVPITTRQGQLGNGGTGAQSPPPGEATPQISALRVSPKRFRTAHGHHGGTTISYRDSVAATTTITVARITRRAAHVVGRLEHVDAPGPNRVRFAGRLAGKPLAPGTYRLMVSAKTAAGARSQRQTVTFVIVR